MTTDHRRVFTPGIRPRGVQTLDDIILSQTRTRSSLPKTKIIRVGTGTTAQEAADASGRGHVRLIRLKVFNDVTAGPFIVEVYFTLPSAISADLETAQTANETVVDLLRVGILGEDATRTYPLGLGPRGDHLHSLYFRFRSSPNASEHWVITEYTVES